MKTEERRPETPSRGVALYLAACFAGGSLPSAWLALLTWAFTTMVNPELEDRERMREIVDRLFFLEGPGPGTMLVAMTWASATCLVATATFLFVAIARFPSFATAMVISCVGGTILAVIALSLLFTLG